LLITGGPEITPNAEAHNYYNESPITMGPYGPEITSNVEAHNYYNELPTTGGPHGPQGDPINDPYAGTR